MSKETCEVISLLSLFFYYMSWTLIICLCLEIYIILKWRAYKSKKIRGYFYLVLSFILSGTISLIYFKLNSAGLSEYQTCFVKTQSPGEDLDIMLNITLILLITFSYILSKRLLGCCYNPAIKHLNLVIKKFILTIFLSRGISVVLWFLKKHQNDDLDIFVILGSTMSIISGFTIGLCRLSHPKVRQKIKLFFLLKKNEEFERPSSRDDEQLLASILSSSLDEPSDDLADMVDHLGHKIIIQILVLLTLKYKEQVVYCDSLEKALKDRSEPEKTKHYDFISYRLLAIELNLPFIKRMYCNDLSIVEYRSSVFDLICKSAGFNKEDLLSCLMSFENLKTLAQIENKGGKSDSFFYCPANQKILIKTINEEESRTFLNILPAYAKRVVKHPESKLVRVLGLFRILPQGQDFIIMENVLPDKQNCVIFDLKGSTVDRHVGGVDSTNPPTGMVLKDLNFKRFDEKIRVEDGKSFRNVLKKDMNLLRKNKIMDYSILLGIYCRAPANNYKVSETTCLSIIDLFQRYNSQKSLENFWKKSILRKHKDISSVPPNKYYKRIKEFLKSITEEL